MLTAEQQLRELRWHEKSLQQLMPLLSYTRQKRLKVLLEEVRQRIRELAEQTGEGIEKAA